MGAVDRHLRVPNRLLVAFVVDPEVLIFGLVRLVARYFVEYGQVCRVVDKRYILDLLPQVEHVRALNAYLIVLSFYESLRCRADPADCLCDLQPLFVAFKLCELVFLKEWD